MTEKSDDQQGPPVADMEALVLRAREFMGRMAGMAGMAKTRQTPFSPDELRSRFALTPRGVKKPEVILAEDCFVELGHPSTASVSTVLVTYRPDLVHHGDVTVAGPDIPDMAAGERRALGQVILVAVDPVVVPDPFSLENAQYLMHRLPGWMVRAVPGRLWVRVGRRQKTAGLSLWAVGSALAVTLMEDFPGVSAAEVLFVTSGQKDVAALEQLALEASILSGKHKKLVLGMDGEVECSELACDTCDEKPVCDNLRDVV
ncbi:MAG: hypothetical protein KKA60_10135, partial [Proteobacteria bacterium]|nr:hypothetical protein [Pseudomonadota bacterium]